jgi:hypothetical protein
MDGLGRSNAEILRQFFPEMVIFTIDMARAKGDDEGE